MSTNPFNIAQGLAQGVAQVVGAALTALLTKPARDMTNKEAIDLVKYLVSTNEMSLSEPIKNDTQDRIVISTSMAKVQYKQAQGKNPGRFGSIGATVTPTFNPTPAFAIVLYRLAVRLRDKWGATSLVWGGIGGGSGKHTSDCHMNGHCVDFYGGTTSRGGTLDVRRDWAFRAVYRKNGTSPVNDDGDRWGSDQQTYYRLLVTKDAEEKDPSEKDYYNPNARDFFLDVFTLISEECIYGSWEIDPVSIRAGSLFKAGYTIHPDYPTLLRRPHNDHIHFQLGQAIQQP
jgi:hypothetical protein